MSNSDSGLTAKRSNRLLVAVLTALCAVSASALYAQDYARLGERTILGTARYIGMGGAMSAIGGDPSAVHDNPAGLGLYRRTEVMITFDECMDKTKVKDNNYTSFRNCVSIPQASVVISLPSYKDSDEGIQFNNVMFSYHRLRTYNRDIYATRQTPSPSLGNLLYYADVDWDIPFCSDRGNATSGLQLNESGQVNEFAVDWSMNISNRWFVGAGVHAQSARLYSDAVYSEVFKTVNQEGRNMTIKNSSSLILTNASVSGALGLIYRPIMWLRIGFGLQTASLGAMRTYASGKLTALYDSLRTSYAPDIDYSDSKFHMPWHTSTSVACQIGAYGMISFQHDYFHQKGETDRHSLRAGFEVIPILGMYINAGYAYESTFKNDTRIVGMDPTFVRQDTYFMHPKDAHYASVALGYRGTYVIVQAAYQYCRQQFNLWPHEEASPFAVTADTHRIVLTLAWHRY
ncbi:MAG: hypothetical protein J5884_00510 [Paludibacteraceae bacterium]|nr:hypothetical protein [Paludibacteraceae bacterium]